MTISTPRDIRLRSRFVSMPLEILWNQPLLISNVFGSTCQAVMSAFLCTHLVLICLPNVTFRSKHSTLLGHIHCILAVSPRV